MYDAIDRRIIGALREHSDHKIREYTKETGVPKSTLHARLSRLCCSDVRCMPIIDFAKLGYSITIFFLTPYQEGLWEHPCVNSCQHLSPDTLLLECVFRDMKQADAFKQRMKIARYFMLVDVLKREGFVPS